MARSLGVSNPAWIKRAGDAAVTVGIAIMVGNISIPLAVLFGIIGG
jgi:hypothetical protein